MKILSTITLYSRSIEKDQYYMIKLCKFKVGKIILYKIQTGRENIEIMKTVLAHIKKMFYCGFL